MENEKHVGRNGNNGHTHQIDRIKLPDGTGEFSLYRKRQRAKGRRSCSTRIWLLKRSFDTGLLLKARITAGALEQLEPLSEPDKLARCEELLATSKQRTTARETPERVAQ